MRNCNFRCTVLFIATLALGDIDAQISKALAIVQPNQWKRLTNAVWGASQEDHFEEVLNAVEIISYRASPHLGSLVRVVTNIARDFVDRFNLRGISNVASKFIKVVHDCASVIDEERSVDSFLDAAHCFVDSLPGKVEWDKALVEKDEL
eukprot:jgi/Bigna1/147546/aug1.194_g22254